YLTGGRCAILGRLTAAPRFVRLCAEQQQIVRMDITKAVITAAGQSQRTLPLQSLVDRDGVTKTALVIIIEEILQAGLEEICVVIWPGDQAAYANAAGTHGSRLKFVEQTAPLGYGHAVHCARGFAAE